MDNNKKVKSRKRPNLKKKSKKKVKKSDIKSVTTVSIKENKVDDPILLKFGYNNKNNTKERQASLSNAVIVLGPNNLKKKLDLLHSNHSENVFKVDKEWVDGNYKK
jgi:hypothetical protein